MPATDLLKRKLRLHLTKQERQEVVPARCRQGRRRQLDRRLPEDCRSLQRHGAAHLADREPRRDSATPGSHVRQKLIPSAAAAVRHVRDAGAQDRCEPCQAGAARAHAHPWHRRMMLHGPLRPLPAAVVCRGIGRDDRQALARRAPARKNSLTETGRLP